MATIKDILGAEKANQVKQKFETSKSVKIPKKLKTKMMTKSNSAQKLQGFDKYVTMPVNDNYVAMPMHDKIDGEPTDGKNFFGSFLDTTQRLLEQGKEVKQLFAKDGTPINSGGTSAGDLPKDDDFDKVLGMPPILGYTVIVIIVLIILYIIYRLVKK